MVRIGLPFCIKAHTSGEFVQNAGTEVHLAALRTFRLLSDTFMPTPSRFKQAQIVILSLVLVCAGVAVFVGLFGLLIELSERL